ncbi:hypothetical protein N9064_00650 [bacterium]|nr:hypothetical protein [bacterium]
MSERFDRLFGEQEKQPVVENNTTEPSRFDRLFGEVEEPKDSLLSNLTKAPIVSLIGEASEDDSKFEEVARDVGGFVGDLAISEGLPLLAGVGAGITATPFASIPAYLATRASAGALGSIFRQQVSNPKGVEKGQLASDTAVNIIPFIGEGKSLMKALAKQTAMGASIGFAGYGVEAAADENVDFTKKEALQRTGIGALLGAAPTAIAETFKGVKRGTNKVFTSAQENLNKQSDTRLAQLDKQTAEIQEAKAIETKKLENSPVEANELVAIEQSKNPASSVTFENLIKTADARDKTKSAPRKINDFDTREVATVRPNETTALNKANYARIEERTGVFNETADPDRVAFLGSLNEAGDKGLLDYETADKLIETRLKEDKPFLADDEFAALVHRQMTREEQLDGLNIDLENAITQGDLVKIRTATLDIENTQNKIDDIIDLSKKSGTVTGRALAARNLALQRNRFGYAEVVNRVKAGRGSKVTPKDLSNIRSLTSENKSLQDQITKLQSEAPIENRAMQIRDLNNYIKTTKVEKPEAAGELIEEGFKELEALGIQLNDITNIGPNGLKSANAVRKIATGYIKQGVRDIPTLLKKIQASVPEVTENDLLFSINQRVKRAESVTVKKYQEKLAGLEEFTQLQAQINEALGFTKKFTKDKKAVSFDSKEIELLKLNITKMENKLHKVVGDQKKYTNLMSQLNEAKAHLDTGSRALSFRKDPVYTAEQAKVKESLKQTNKELGLEDDLLKYEELVTDGAEWAIKEQKHITNKRIVDLRKERDVLIKKLKSNKENNPINLRAKADAKYEADLIKFNEIEQEIAGGYRAWEPAKQVKWINSLQEDLTARIKEAAKVRGSIDDISKISEELEKLAPKPVKSVEELSPRLEGLKIVKQLLQKDLKERRGLTDVELKKRQDRLIKHKEERLRKATEQHEGFFRYVRDNKPKVNDKVTTEQLEQFDIKIKDIEAQMRVADATENMREKIRNKDFVEEIPEATKKSAELEKLQGKQVGVQRELKDTVYRANHARVEQVIADTIKAKGALKGSAELLSLKKFKQTYKNLDSRDWGEFALAAGNVPRELMATMDFSAIMRQGFLLNMRQLRTDRKALGDNIVKSLKAWKSQTNFDELQGQLSNHPRYNEMVRSGIHFSDVGADMNQREEIFYGSLAEHIPALGKIIKMSNRHMVSFLNMQRATTMLDFLTKHPNATPEMKKAFAGYINISSGRGNLGMVGEQAQVISQLMFSPRYALSRYQAALAPAWNGVKGYTKKDAGAQLVAKESSKDLAMAAGFGITILAMAKSAGADVSLDPRESEFGKITVGSHHYDIFGGMLPVARQIAYGGMQGLDHFTDVDWDTKKRADALAFEQLRYKASPQMSWALEAMTGKDVFNKEISLGETTARHLLPITAQTPFDSYSEDPNLVMTILDTGAEALGLGVSTYK